MIIETFTLSQIVSQPFIVIVRRFFQISFRNDELNYVVLVQISYSRCGCFANCKWFLLNLNETVIFNWFQSITTVDFICYETNYASRMTQSNSSENGYIQVIFCILNQLMSRISFLILVKIYRCEWTQKPNKACNKNKCLRNIIIFSFKNMLFWNPQL